MYTLQTMDQKLCLHWVMTSEVEKPPVPIKLHWYACRGTAPIDQEALAHAWGLAKEIDRQPYPPAMPSLHFAIY